ncbi:uncharacterized protein RJT20DRAFT_130580 [Scheffersomyces xylosifermentans]|uniref:uncharacterized protein n=1 Tax=Scheffersomyces xylosifermentans TaxID=1304137 RepID=UPI00315DEAE6
MVNASNNNGNKTHQSTPLSHSRSGSSSTAGPSKQAVKHKSSGSNSSSVKWISQIRTLPSNPNTNDFLKLEYIDINLNNSRKLIGNLNDLTDSTSGLINDIDLKVNGNLIQLNQVRSELAWLDGI